MLSSKQERIGQYFSNKKDVKTAYIKLKAAIEYAESYPGNQLAVARLEKAEEAFSKSVKDYWGCEATQSSIDEVKESIEKISLLRQKAARIKKDKKFLNLFHKTSLSSTEREYLEVRFAAYGFINPYAAEQFLLKAGLIN